jgi:hypothetical protein
MFRTANTEQRVRRVLTVIAIMMRVFTKPSEKPVEQSAEHNQEIVA